MLSLPAVSSKVPNTGDLVPRAEEQVHVEFHHFPADAVDWFLLTIFAPNGFHDWEVAS